MFKIKTTDGVEMYIAPGEVSRLVARDYDGGGTVIVMRDGTRVATYTGIDDVYALMTKAVLDA